MTSKGQMNSEEWPDQCHPFLLEGPCMWFRAQVTTFLCFSRSPTL